MENLYSYYLQVLFLTLIVINHLFEVYLSQRQLSALHLNRVEVPTAFSHFLSLEDHQKSIQYATSKLRFGQVRLVWDAIILFYWFPLRGIEKLYLTLPLTGIHKEALFLLSFTLIQAILNLPWSLYSTFVLEEKFGFNRSTPKLFFMDLTKGLLLGSALGIPLLYGSLFIFQTAGQWWWLVCFIFITSFQFFIVWLYPTVIAPLFNKFQPLESEELKTGIENLVTRSGFNAKEVFVMDASKRSSHGNAYFTGFGKKKRVVFFDTLLKHLKDKEILAILAHELGHMKLKHIPKSLITSLIFSFLGFFMMGRLSQENWFYSGHFARIVSPGILFLLFMQATPQYLFWFSPLSSWISRKREFEADQYAAEETDAQDLISGLLKLYQQNSSPVVTDALYSTFYHSHPPALERIKKLESIQKKVL